MLKIRKYRSIDDPWEDSSAVTEVDLKSSFSDFRASGEPIVLKLLPPKNTGKSPFYATRIHRISGLKHG